MAWISVEQTLIGKKLRVLAKDVGCSQNEAIGILINLWLWGMDNASMDGLMDGAEIADIALAIKPCLSESLDPEEVVSKLLDNGWIDCNEEELFIHDWEEYRYYYNKYVSEKKQHSKRQREYVARKRAAEKAATKLKEQKEQKLEKTVPEEKLWMEMSELLSSCETPPDRSKKTSRLRKSSSIRKNEMQVSARRLRIWMI